MSRLSRLGLIQFRAGYNLPVHAAAEHGIFARYGLEVEIAYTPGSNYLIEALQTGEFDIGHPAADDVVAAAENEHHEKKGNARLCLFMGLHSGLFSLISAPDCGDVRSLRGRALGVDSATTGFVFLLEKFLRSNGLASHDYKLMEIGGWELRYRALHEKKIAATLLTPPFVADALAWGCHLLVRGDGILPVYQATCGATRRSWAENNRGLLVRYIRAYVEATQWCFEPKNRAASLALLGKHHGIYGRSAEAALDALLDPAYGIYPTAELNLNGLAAVLELRAEMGYLKRPVPPLEDYIDCSFYRQATGVQG
jgi:ABC-type nitrate/sulfonate/bicarbonate transport system substrate-binding protein